MQHHWEALDRTNLIVLEEQGLGLFSHDDLLFRLGLGFFSLATSNGILVLSQRDAVVEQDGVNLLRLGSPDHQFFRLSDLGLLLSVFFVSGTSVLVLDK